MLGRTRALAPRRGSFVDSTKEETEMTSMRAMWWTARGMVFGASIGLTACGGGSANSEPPASAPNAAADDEAMADLTEHHRHHHHGGVTMFIAMSLDSLGISEEQRITVEKIQTDLYAKMEPARVAEQNLVLAIADGIAAGNVDQGKVDSAVAAVASAASGLHDAAADALNQLHAVLTPPQRAALVDKVKAHWYIWKRANTEENQAGGGRREHLAKLANELGLTPDQVSKIQAGLGASKSAPPFDPQEIDAHLSAFSAAFEADPFDAKSLSHEGSANAHLAGWGAAHMAGFFVAVGPVLSPEQRTKLAAMLREHASHKEDSAGS
jgi:Spy/CpxP family protein refolding chaperone